MLGSILIETLVAAYSLQSPVGMPILARAAYNLNALSALRFAASSLHACCVSLVPCLVYVALLVFFFLARVSHFFAFS